MLIILGSRYWGTCAVVCFCLCVCLFDCFLACWFVYSFAVITYAMCLVPVRVCRVDNHCFSVPMFTWEQIDYDSKLSTSHLRRSAGARRRQAQNLAASHPVRCFVACFRGDLTAIRR